MYVCTYTYISRLVKYRARKRWLTCKINLRRVVHFVAALVKVRGAVKGQRRGGAIKQIDLCAQKEKQ